MEVQKELTSLVPDWGLYYFAWLAGGKGHRTIGNHSETFLTALVHYGLSSCLGELFTTMSKEMIKDALQSNRTTDLDETDLEEPLEEFERPALSHICEFRFPKTLDNESFSVGTLKMAQLLLDNGADPNKGFQGETPWEMVLLLPDYCDFSSETLSRNQKLCWIAIVRTFLEHGANPAAAARKDDGQTFTLQYMINSLLKSELAREG